MVVLHFIYTRQFLTFFSSISLGLAILASCTFGESFESYVAKGRAALEKKDPTSAIIQFKNAAQKKNDDAEVRYLLATAYIETGDFPSAEKELRQAKQLKFDPALTQVALSKALLGQAKHRELLDEIQPDPSYAPAPLAEILSLRGTAYLGIGQHADARSQFAKAQHIDPKSARAQLGEVQVLLAESNSAQAQVLNNQVLTKHPSFAPAWLIQGDLSRAQSQSDKALASYSKAIELEPSYFVAYVKLASLLVDTKQLAKAQAQIDLMKKMAPFHPLTQHLQAHVYYLQRNFRGAEEAIQNALKADGSYPPTLLLAGAIAQEKGAVEQGETYFSKVLGEYPNYVYARKLLATAQLKAGKIDNALTTLQPLVSLTSPQSDSLFLAGEAHMAKGEYAKASEYFSKAAALEPKNAMVRTSLGASWLASGDAERGLAELESASRLDPGQSKADVILIVNHLAKREFDQALKRIAELKKKEPANANVLNLEGQAYIAKKDMANARKIFEEVAKLQPNNVSAAINLAQLDIQEANPESARRRLEGVISQDQDNLQAMLGLAQLSLNGGREQEYVSWLNKAIKSHPQVLQPRSMLASFYLQKKEPQKALLVARDAQAANPDNPDILGFLGAIQFAVGETENALATMRMKPNMKIAHAILALNYLRDGESDKALKSAQFLQETQPRNPDGFTLAGVAYAQKKEYSKARAAFSKALALAPSDPGASRNLAVIAIQEGNVIEARALLQDVLAKHPGQTGVVIALADLDMQAGQGHLAEQRLTDALAKTPDALGLRYALGKIYITQRKAAQVLELTEKAPAHQANDPSILELRGAAQLQMGKPALAVKSLEAATQARPNSASGYVQLALAYELLNDLPRANQALQAAVKVDPGSRPARFAQARLMVKNGKIEEAQALLKKLNTEDPNDSSVIELRGDLSMMQNRPKEAITLYKTALAKRETNFLTVRTAASQIKAADRDGGIATLQAWLKRFPEDFYVRNALAEALLGLAQPKEASVHLAKLAEQQPNNIVVINNLAWALLETGAIDSAWTQAQRAYKLAPEQPQVLDTYGMVLMRKGKFAEAREILQGASSKQPNDASIQIHLAQAFVAEGQPAKARQVLSDLLAQKNAFPQRSQADELLAKLK